MIISHEHQFIFIKTEKTAGTSVEIALSGICGPRDIITPINPVDEMYRKELGYPGPQNHILSLKQYKQLSKFDLALALYKRKRIAFYNHIPAREIKNLVSEDVWNNYYKFTIERNPYDKAISMYYWVSTQEKFDSLSDFLLQGKAAACRGFELYTIGGIPAVDKIYQFEDMNFFLDHLSQKLKLKEKLQLPAKKTKSVHRKDKRHYREILTPEEAKWISIIFAREIALMNYEF